jgi:hypothetical protein
MSFPTLSLPAQLPPSLRTELEQVFASIAAWMQQEHNDDGTHSTITASGTITERRRTKPMGAYTDVAYNTANFTASTGTWGVDLADVVTYAWAIVGQTMTVWFEIDTTDVSAAPATLGLAIPGGYKAARRTVALIQAIDAGGVATGVAFVSADGAVINFQASVAGAGWTTTAADNTSVRGQISFPIKGTS